MMTFAYTYVGPAEIKQAALDSPPGTPIESAAALRAWLRINPEATTEGATYVVELNGILKLAPRRSEHVACASGAEVLAAGEVRFQADSRGLRVVDISNQSTGYCPDTTCWPAVSRALQLEGVAVTETFTRLITFRRCVACNEINLVKERWFVCTFCDADLPQDWNVSRRRAVESIAGESIHVSPPQHVENS